MSLESSMDDLQEAVRLLTEEVVAMRELLVTIATPTSDTTVPPDPPQGAAVAATTPTSEFAPSPELDTDGRPWDERIDSSGKTKTKSGHWTAKRGVDAEERKRVIQELKAQHAPEEGHDTPAPPPPQDADGTPFAPIPSPEAPPGGEPASSGLDFNAVKLRTAAVARALGPNATRITDLLGRFGVARLSALPENRYPEFVQRLAELEQGGEP